MAGDEDWIENLIARAVSQQPMQVDAVNTLDQMLRSGDLTNSYLSKGDLTAAAQKLIREIQPTVVQTDPMTGVKS